MPNLRNLFDALNNNEFCRYSTDRPYPITQNEKEFTPLELLEIGRDSPREQVVIGYFGEHSPTRVAYTGDDADSMKQTLNQLGLPSSWPSNLGEKVFYIFRGLLENNHKTGPIQLEQTIILGNELKLELALKKLIWVYSGKEIDEEFFESLKQQSGNR